MVKQPAVRLSMAKQKEMERPIRVLEPSGRTSSCNGTPLDPQVPGEKEAAHGISEPISPERGYALSKRNAPDLAPNPISPIRKAPSEPSLARDVSCPRKRMRYTMQTGGENGSREMHTTDSSQPLEKPKSVGCSSNSMVEETSVEMSSFTRTDFWRDVFESSAEHSEHSEHSENCVESWANEHLLIQASPGYPILRTKMKSSEPLEEQTVSSNTEYRTFHLREDLEESSADFLTDSAKYIRRCDALGRVTDVTVSNEKCIRDANRNDMGCGKSSLAIPCDPKHLVSESVPYPPVFYLWNYKKKQRSFEAFTCRKALDYCVDNPSFVLYDGQDFNFKHAKSRSLLRMVEEDEGEWEKRDRTFGTYRLKCKVRIWNPVSKSFLGYKHCPEGRIICSWLKIHPDYTIFSPSMINLTCRIQKEWANVQQCDSILRISSAWERLASSLRAIVRGANFVNLDLKTTKDYTFWNALKHSRERRTQFSNPQDFLSFWLSNPWLEVYFGQNEKELLEQNSRHKLIPILLCCPGHLVSFWDSRTSKRIAYAGNSSTKQSISEYLNANSNVQLYLGQDLQERDVIYRTIEYYRQQGGFPYSFVLASYSEALNKFFKEKRLIALHIDVHEYSTAASIFWDNEKKRILMQPESNSKLSIQDFTEKHEGRMELYRGQDTSAKLQDDLRRWFHVLQFKPGYDGINHQPLLTRREFLPETPTTRVRTSKRFFLEKSDSKFKSLTTLIRGKLKQIQNERRFIETQVNGFEHQSSRNTTKGVVQAIEAENRTERPSPEVIPIKDVPKPKKDVLLKAALCSNGTQDLKQSIQLDDLREQNDAQQSKQPQHFQKVLKRDRTNHVQQVSQSLDVLKSKEISGNGPEEEQGNSNGLEKSSVGSVGSSKRNENSGEGTKRKQIEIEGSHRRKRRKYSSPRQPEETERNIPDGFDGPEDDHSHRSDEIEVRDKRPNFKTLSQHVSAPRSHRPDNLEKEMSGDDTKGESRDSSFNSSSLSEQHPSQNVTNEIPSTELNRPNDQRDVHRENSNDENALVNENKSAPPDVIINKSPLARAMKESIKQANIIKTAGRKVLGKMLLKDMRQDLREDLLKEVSSSDDLDMLSSRARSPDFLLAAEKLCCILEEISWFFNFSDVQDIDQGFLDIDVLRDDLESGKLFTMGGVVNRFRGLCEATLRFCAGDGHSFSLVDFREQAEKLVKDFLEERRELVEEENHIKRVVDICSKAQDIGFCDGDKTRRTRRSAHLKASARGRPSIKVSGYQSEVTFRNYRDEQGHSVMGKRHSARVLGISIDQETCEARNTQKSTCHICNRELFESRGDSLKCANHTVGLCKVRVCRECLETSLALTQAEFIHRRQSDDWICVHCSDLCHSREMGSLWCAGKHSASEEKASSIFSWPYNLDATSVSIKLVRRSLCGDFPRSGGKIISLSKSGACWTSPIELHIGTYRCTISVDKKEQGGTIIHALSEEKYIEELGKTGSLDECLLPSALKKTQQLPKSREYVIRWAASEKTMKGSVQSFSASDGGERVRCCSRTEGYDWRRAKRHAVVQWIPTVKRIGRKDQSYDGVQKLRLSASLRKITGLHMREDFPKLQIGMKQKEFLQNVVHYKFDFMKQKTLWGIVTGTSEIHGIGLFTLTGYQKGDFVIEYAGDLIRSPLADIREEQYEAAGLGTYLFRIDDMLIVDATVNSNRARFTNHSCDPNMGAEIITVRGRKLVVLLATRDIPPHSELTFHYQLPLEDKKLQCLCNSWNCEGVMN